MADFTRVQFGAVNSAGAADALFLKKFGGEVLAAFTNATVFDTRQRVRTIDSGKSAAFPATGTLTAAYHTPGTQIVGTAMNHNERVITIDDLLLANAFVSNVEEAKAHWDVRGPISEQLGDALAQQYDKNVAQVGVLAARASATVSGGNGGTVISAGATVTTDASVLAAAIFTGAQTLDEKFVRSKERYVALKPALYYLAAQKTTLIDKDWDGRGSYADGTIQSIAGITIVKSNNVPSTNVNSGPSAYQGNFTATKGLIWVPDAMGTVKLLSLAMEAAYQIMWQGTPMVAKYAVGHGILRPECAIEIVNT
jgi:hypothetical protein